MKKSSNLFTNIFFKSYKLDFWEWLFCFKNNTRASLDGIIFVLFSWPCLQVETSLQENNTKIWRTSLGGEKNNS